MRPGSGTSSSEVPEVGHRAGARGDPREHLLGVGQPALDPGPQLADGGRRRALGRARREHDLDPGVGVHVHPHPPRAGGAAHGVGDLLGHAAEGTGTAGFHGSASFSALTIARVAGDRLSVMKWMPGTPALSSS